MPRKTNCDCDERHLIGVEYPYDHPDRYDGVSEWRCLACGKRVGRWTGRELVGEETEPRHGGTHGASTDASL